LPPDPTQYRISHQHLSRPAALRSGLQAGCRPGPQAHAAVSLRASYAPPSTALPSASCAPDSRPWAPRDLDAIMTSLTTGISATPRPLLPGAVRTAIARMDAYLQTRSL